MGTNNQQFKGKKAVFVISCSPFQVMCLIEAVHAFELRDYKVLICYDDKELPREKNTFRLLEKYGIKYEVESFNYRITKTDRLKMLKPVHNGFDLAFIGDCCDELLCYKAIRYVSDGSTLIYIDDGTATIHFFNGLFQITGKLRKYYDLVTRIRRLDFDNFFFTIYKGLSDDKHSCIINSFNFFASQQLKKGEPKNIILLGVSTDVYCNVENITADVYFTDLHKLIVEIQNKYPNDSIIFVPHGKDTYNTPKEICDKMGLIYQPSEISVEMMLLESPDRPKAVYGFRSSALYNIKLLFPDTDVVNVTFQGNQKINKDIEKASEYYERHGITRLVRQL